MSVSGQSRSDFAVFSGVYEQLCGLRKQVHLALFSLFALLLWSLQAVAAPVTFTVASVPNHFTLILEDPDGRQLTVTLPSVNADCYSVNSAGRVGVFATANTSRPGCNMTTIINFSADGFTINQLNFADIDDMDGSTSRDAFAADVPGTWSSTPNPADGVALTVAPLVGPGAPAYADQRARFTAAGAIGDFVSRATGNNPLNDNARFVLTTPVQSFNIIHDDVEGSRSAFTFFDLSSITIDINVPPTANPDQSLGNTLETPVSLPVLGNDTDGDAPIDPTTVSLVVPAGVTLAGPPTVDLNGDIIGFEVVGEGTWAYSDATGQLTFTPAPGFVGDPTDITYTVDDLNGETSNEAAVNIEYVDPDPSLSVTKSADTSALNSPLQVGDQLTFTFEVTNTGNLALGGAGLLPTDTMTYGTDGSGAPVANPMTVVEVSESITDDGILELGETITYRGTFTLDQAAINAGGVHNTASATGNPVDSTGADIPGLADVSDDSDNDNAGDGTDGPSGGPDNNPTVVTLPQSPEIGASKSAVVGALQANGTFDVTYTILVRNTGNVVLNNLTLVDDLTAADQLAGAFNTVVSQPVVSPLTFGAGSTLPANTTSYDGTNSLIGAGGVLAVGDSYRVVFTVNVDPNAPNQPAGGLDNTATAGGSAPVGGVIVTDASDNGTNPSANPGEPTGTPTPITPPTETPAIGLVKTSVLNDDDGTPGVTAGDTIDYTYVVTNLSDTVDVYNVTVSEPDTAANEFSGTGTLPVPAHDGVSGSDLDGGDGTPTDIAVGESVTFTASYTITQADIDAGGVTNSAVASGTDPAGNTPTDTSDESDPAAGNDNPTETSLGRMPGLTVTKSIASVTDVNGNGLTDTDDVITYVFTVTNTGNTSLADVRISDPKLGLVTVAVTPADIAPGQTAQLTGQSYTIQAADVAAGGVENTAEASGQPVATGPGGVPDASTPLRDDVGNILADVQDTSDAGTAPELDSAGNPVAVADPENTETADLGGNTDGNAGNDPTVLNIAAPSISLVKSVANVLDTNGDGLFGGEDDEIVYSFLVRNTGNVSIANITISDPLLPVTGGPITLAPGAGDSTTFTATYIVQAADIARGFLENTATVSGAAVDGAGNPLFGPGGGAIGVSDISDTGTDPDQQTISNPEGTETPDGAGNTDGNTTNDPTVQSLPANPNPELTLVKSVASVADSNGSGLLDAGDTVTYSFTVTNTGNVRIANVTVSDPRAGPVSGGPIVLEVGQTDTTTFTASAVITAAEASAGAISNTATATGAAVNSAGDPIRNPDTGAPLSASDSSDAGTEPEIGTSGTPTTIADPDGTGTADDPTVLSLPMPAFELVKSVANVADTNGSGAVDAGDTVTYAFRVTNTGNTDLQNVTVSDALPGLVFTTSTTIASLPQGATNSAVMAQYQLTQADIIAGVVENSAEATGTAVDSTGQPFGDPFDPGNPLTVDDTSDAGTDPDGNTVANPGGIETEDANGNTDGQPGNDPTVLKIEPSPELTLTKSVSSVVDTNGNNLIDAGDTINFAFSVANTGNVAVANISISDPLVGPVSGGPINLAIGASDSSTFTASYVIAAGDVTAGFVQNTATANGAAVDASGNPIENPAMPGTLLGVSDTSDSGTNPELDNTGQPTSVADPENTETPDAGGATDGMAGNDPTVLNIARPQLELIKSVANVPDTNGDGLFGGEDDQIVFSFIVRNTGNVDLSNIMVTDPLLPIIGGPIDLAVGAGDSLTFSAVYTVTAADITRGFVENSASVTGEAVDSSGNPILGPNGTQITTTDDSDAGTTADQQTVSDPSGTETPDGSGNTDGNPTNDPTVQTVPSNPSPALTVVKSVAGIADTNGSGVIDAGDTVSYTFVVTNTGNVRLGNVTVDDPRAAPVSGGPIILEIGDTDSTTFTASAVITAAEAAAGAIENTATATGGAINSMGDPISDPDTGNQLTASDDSDAGTEPDIGITGSPTPIPDPAGTGPGGDDPTILTLPMPQMQVVKSVASVADTNGSGAVDAGDTVSYGFAVTNTGNTTLEDISVSDPLPGLVFTTSTVIPSLAQGATDTSVMAQYVLTAADITAGFVENTASATGTAVDSNGDPLGDPFNPGAPLTVSDTSDAGTTPSGDPVADPEGTETPDGSGGTDGMTGNDPTVFSITPSPQISVTKAIASITDSNGNGLVDAGDTVNYSFSVSNTGNVNLTDVRISDALVNVSGGPIALNIGATDSSSFTAAYQVTAADVAAGGIENTARAFGTATAADGSVIENPNNPGSAFEVSDASDSGTQPDLDGTTGAPVPVNNPETTETPGLGGTTDGLANNDPTVLNILRPEITLTKSVSNVFDTNGDGLFGGEGDEVHFSFFVRNTGNVDLTGITVSDPMVTMSGGPIDLAAGAANSIAFTGIYVVQAADVTAGFIENSATAAGAAESSAGNPINGLDGNPITVTDVSDAGTTGQQQDVSDPPNEETPDGAGNTDGNPGNDPTVQTIPANPNPALRVVKSVTAVADTNGSGVIDAGDTVTYGFVVTNTGNVRLADVSIEDARAPVSGGPVTLDVGAVDSTTFTATAVITDAEAAAGSISNTATANGNAVNSAGDPFRDPDTGTPLTASDVSDAGTEPEMGPDGTPPSIADPEATGAGGDDPTLLAIPNPSISVIKSVSLVEDTNGDGLFGSAGDIIRYTFAVTNTGNTTLNDITVTDVNADISGGPITLAPGATNTTAFTGSHLIIAAEFNAGFVENTARVTSTPVSDTGDPVRGPDGAPLVVEDNSDAGTDAEGDPVANPETVETPDGAGTSDGQPDNDPTVLTVPTNPRPMLQLVKSVDSVSDADNDAVLGGVDDVITFRFTVTNTGNTDLVNVVVNDPLLGGAVGTVPALAIGESQEFFANYTIVAADEQAGFVQNTATTTGDAVNSSGDPFLDPDTGVQLTATDDSDAGTDREAGEVPDNEGTETPPGTGEPDNDPTNDPTVVNVPLTPSDASISGTVYIDNDRDGVFDPDTDTRAPGFRVVLYDSDGNIVAETVSDSMGMYLMEGFGVGQDYFVEFIDPDTGEVVGRLDDLDFDRNTVLTEQNQDLVGTLPSDTLTLAKTTSVSTVVVGQTVPYEIAVSNPGAFTVENVNIIDRLPAGMVYTPGTATVNAVPTEPTINGPSLSWSGLTVAPGTDSVVITLNARVTSAAGLGELTNVASAVDSVTGVALSDSASATVVLRPEHVFDCSDIIGKVFDDRNANGYQDDPNQPRRGVSDQSFSGKYSVDPRGEPGLPNVRLVTQTGSIITTDEHGRFSVPCAELPGRFGANFSLKLDERSLPSGYRMTTENPRTMRVTAGIMTEMNFGASISRVIDIDLTAAAFKSGSDEPSVELAAGLEQLLGQIVDTPSVIRIAYFHEGEDRKLIRARGNSVEELIRKRWKRIGRYKLTVERTTKRMQ